MLFDASDKCLSNLTANAIGLPKILKVVSLAPPVENSDTSSNTTAQEKTSTDPAVGSSLATVSTPPTQSTDTLEEGEVPDGPLTAVRKLKAQLKASAELGGDEEEERQEKANDEATKDGGVDPTLMSLLNEIVFLNQQLSSDGSKPSTPCHAPQPEPGEVLVDRPAARVALDDARSPSPLVLRLDDEEAETSTPTKSTSTNTPETAANEPSGAAVGSEPSVKLVPASGSTPPLTPETNGQSQPMESIAVKGDALAPPPLLQMKAGSVAPPVTPSPKEKLSWRPMPKLVPLGLKGTPQTSLSRGTGSSP